MNGNILALGAVGALALGAAASARGSRSALRPVVALYIDRERGPYARLPGVTAWGVAEDATAYNGPHSCVLHPPCGHWGNYSAKAHDDGHTGPIAVAQVRKFGGVLEHPRRSKLWAACGMPRPGEPPDAFGGYTIAVDQHDWGHPAQKATWLYVVGVDPGDIPPLPPHLPPPPALASGRVSRGVVERMAKSKRHLTPPLFAAWLVELARRVKMPRKGSCNVESPAFWRWFGNSAVVDDTGAPLVVFHGTSAVFNTFDKKMRGFVSESSDSKVGFFFTSSLRRAEEAARDAAWITKPEDWAKPAPDAARVMRVYLKMDRPLVRHDIQDDPADTARVIRVARRAGHDGVIWMKGERGGRDYVVFEPHQIKSATENSGAFDPKRASIHLNRAGSSAKRKVRPVDLSWLPDVVYHGTCDTFWNEDSAQAATKPVSLCVSDRFKQAREYAVETAWHVRDGDLPGVKDASSWPLIVRMTRADLVAMVERGAEIIGDYGVDDYDFDSKSRTRKNAGARRSYEELGTFCIYGAAAIESFKGELDVEEIDLPGAEENEDEDEFGEDG